MRHAPTSIASTFSYSGCAALLLAGAASAQLTWSQVPSPPARSAAAAACPPDADAILFGGLGGNGALGDTWRFTNQAWVALSPPMSPPPRSHHAMAQVGSGCAVFGGRDAGGATLGDLWWWSPLLQTWTPGFGVPPARESAAFVSGTLGLLFGGRNGAQTFGDTWLLSASGAWQNVAVTGPSPRHGHALVLVEGQSSYYLLFGGIDAAGNHLADTWRLTHPTATSWAWVHLLPQMYPSPRHGHAMRWSQHRGRVQLFGGEGPGGLFSDTWEWNGGNWVLVATGSTPAARADAVLVDSADVAAGSLDGLLVGGRDAAGPLAETWQVTSAIPASAVPFGGPLPSSLSIEVTGAPWVGSSFTIGMGGPFHTILATHVIAGFSNTTSSLGPLPINLGPVFNNLPLLVDPVALLPLPPTGIGLTWTTFAVPLVPSLAGTHLYLQGIAFDAYAGPFYGWNLSPGIDCQLGWL